MRKVNQKSCLVVCGWILSLGFICLHILRLLKPSSKIGGYIYESIYRELWASSICWIIYACHQLKSGGVLRSFLSSNLWQPLSKLCFSTYVIHYIYLDLSNLNQKDLIWLPTCWHIHMYISDIIISFVLGTLFYLIVEAPIGHMIHMMWNLKEFCARG